jgi:phosphatidyl-myo-inositol dimannoside synthase
VTNHATAAPRKVLWLSSNGPRWPDDNSAPFILNLATDLRGLGWDIELLLPQAATLPDRDTIEGVPITRFHYAWPRRLERLCYGAGVLAHLRQHPADLALVPGFIAAQWLAVRARIAQGDIALLHAHWLLPQGLVGLEAARPRRIPVIATAHGGDLFALNGRLSVAGKQRVVRGADAVTVNSSATETVALRLGASPERLHRIPMGAAESTPDPLRVGDLRRNLRRAAGPLLGFVGRLVAEKGIDDLLESVALLQARYRDITLVLVGDGPDRPRFEKRAIELGVAGRVVFVGAVPPGQVVDYLHAIDIFVGPSRRAPNGWVEAQGVVYVEAMLARRPVVATASGGIADLVTNGETGLLVAESSPRQITTAIERLLGDPSLAARLAETGRQRAQAGYTRATSAAAFSSLYSAVPGRRSKK